MSLAVKNGQTSVVLRFKLLDSSSSTGAGLTGLTSASSGLRISTIADNEASATAYTVAGSTVEAVTTLGTYASPTATKCRFKEVDATNHPGLYEFQFADARFAVSSAKSLVISVSGATNMVQADYIVPLVVDDPYTAKLTDKTGFSLASGGLAAVTAWAVAITGNITGNLSGSVGSVTGLTASDVGAIKAKTDNLPSDPADASDIAGAFSTVNSTLATIAGYVDTEVAAIKAKTDLIPASPAATGDEMTLTVAYDAAKAAASQTSVDDLPTNAELATALDGADDATLAAIAALSVPTATQNADALLDRADAVEVGLTPRQAMRLSAAADAGKLSGAATTTNTIRNAVADSKARIVATVDADGNRSAITYDLT